MVRDTLQTHRRQARSGEFNREWNAIELTANAHFQQQGGGTPDRVRHVRARALFEQTDRAEFTRIRVIVVTWDFQRRHTINILARNAQWLATRCKNRRPRCDLQKPFGHLRGAVDQVLAVVEQEQQVSGVKTCREPLKRRGFVAWRETEGYGERCRKEIGRRRCGELREVNTIGEVRNKLARGFEREPGLAYATRPDERDQSVLQHRVVDFTQCLFSTDDRRNSGGKPNARESSWQPRRERRGLSHGEIPDELVAPSCDSQYGRAIVAQSAAQRRDLPLKRVLFDDTVSPNPLHDPIFAQDRTAGFDQGDQKIKRPVANIDLPAVMQHLAQARAYDGSAKREIVERWRLRIHLRPVEQ